MLVGVKITVNYLSVYHALVYIYDSMADDLLT